MCVRLFAVSLLLSMVVSTTFADELTDADAFIHGQMEVRHIPGMSVGILKDGKVLLNKGYGLANVELSAPASPDTVYRVYSVTKQFTAVAVLLLADDQKLSLDDPISKYLPDAADTWRGVTIRHLLSHTSGIPDYTDVPGFFGHIRVDSTPQELIAPLKTQPLQFTPGTRCRYSNANYYLLGMIVEKISGVPFEQFVADRIFRPAGMSASQLDDMTDIIRNRANGYQWIGENVSKPPPIVTGYHGRKNVLQNAVYVSPTRLWAAGGVVSCVNDLIRWEEVLSGGKLLKAETAREMTQPYKMSDGQEGDYGFGNELGEIKGHHFAGHQGSGVGFNSAVLRLVDDHMTVIVLCNQTSAPSLPIAMHLAGLYVPDLRGVVR
jgi:CubicO group peptidase (beta-lactamase class C family)